MFHPFDRVTQDGNGKSRTYTVFDAISCSPNGAEVWKTLSDGSISGLTFSGATLFADGTVGAPSISFTSAPTAGMLAAGGSVLFSTAGTVRGGFTANTNGLAFASGNSIGWVASATDPTGVPDLLVTRDAADTLALRRTTNAQTCRVYNTFTDTSNYERLSAGWSGNIFDLSADAAGTGSVRAIRINGSTIGLRTGGTTRWQVDANGHLVTVADATYDIGATGATRPRNGFFSGTLSYGTFSGNADAPVTGFITITDSGGTTRKLAVIA